MKIANFIGIIRLARILPGCAQCLLWLNPLENSSHCNMYNVLKTVRVKCPFQDKLLIPSAFLYYTEKG